jgi:hypothetical protein
MVAPGSYRNTSARVAAVSRPLHRAGHERMVLPADASEVCAPEPAIGGSSCGRSQALLCTAHFKAGKSKSQSACWIKGMPMTNNIGS